MPLPDITALPVPAALLGESPLWHPDEQVLYWVDIPGRQLHRFDPRTAAHRHWGFDSEPACCVPLLGGGLLLAMRDGLWRFDTQRGERQRLAAPPYTPAEQRYNDGKADAQGRFWVGTLDDQRRPLAALYRHADGHTRQLVAGITTSNGLAFSPDGRTLYWADTKAHAIDAFDVDANDGSLSRRRAFARFAPRTDGQRLAELPLPVRCPTMCCFGGDDLRTLYITTARNGRPADELAAQPLAGCVLQLRVPVPGLPAHLARA
jgi:sugar lactone lactonase YvrE